MSGLDNLVKEIENLSQAEANEILASAKNEAGIIEIDNLKKIEAYSKEISAKAETAAKNLKERNVSNKKIQKRNEILKLKQNIISDVISKARQALPDLPDAEYFELLKSWTKRAEISENAAIYLNAKDLSRNMGDFLSAFPNGAEINKEAADISGGFLAKCGGVTINCSIDSVFEFYSDVINREAQRILFD